MYKLSERLEKLKPYEPIMGAYSVRLDANESFLDTPQWLTLEISEKISKVEYHRYPDPLCTELRKAFGAFFGVDSALVTAGNGSDELISILINSFCPSEKCIALTDPDFSMYRIYAEMANVSVARYMKKEGSLEIDIDGLIAFTRENDAAMLILSNPCNPTSQAIPIMEIRRLVESLDCLVVIDEAYMDFFQGSILALVEEHDNLIVLKTCSKIGMAAIRLGFAVTNRKLTQVFQAVRSPYNVNSMTQTVGCVWFSHPEYIRECVAKICSSRDALYEALNRLSQVKTDVLCVLPSCANFVFIQLTDAKSVFLALQKNGIAVRLMGDYLRITAGNLQENAALLAALDLILR